MKLSRLRTLHVESALGIDRAPYFSWILESENQNTRQTSYEVNVFNEKNEAVWMSGQIHSEKASFVAYEGKPLESCTAYRWNVTVTDNHGETAEAEGNFTTAFMQPLSSGESAKWICAEKPNLTRDRGFGNQPPATVFRRCFEISQMPARVTAYVTARGGYEMTLNGTAPDARRLAVEYSMFDKVHLYQTYDLTALTKTGTNCLDVTVGDGWYCGPKTQLHKNAEQKPHALLYKLQLVYADGHIEWIDSDKNTVSAESPVRSADIFAGEIYDARKALSDRTVWTPCTVCDYPYDTLKAQIGGGIVPVAVLGVKKMYTSPRGETILDFGQNIAGIVRFRTRLEEGQSITLDHFEVPDKAGNYFDSMADAGDVGHGCEQRTQFISAGREEVYAPHFTFHGFRYVRVTAPEGYRIDPADFEAVALSSEKEQVGDFACSDERLNRLYLNTIWSQRANMIAIPTDCPQREKAGWTGDIAIYAKTAMLNEDVTSFLSRWMLSVAADQHENGAVPIAVPFSTAYQDVARIQEKICFNKGPMGACGWGDAAVMVPWALYEVSGNVDILTQNYECMTKWAEYIITSAKRRGSLKNPSKYEKYLWNTGFHYGDWLIPSLAKNGYDKNVLLAALRTKGPVASLFGYHTIRLMESIAGLLGKEEDRLRYGDIADHMKEAINRTMLSKDGKLRREYQGIYVLLLAFDVLPEDKKRIVADNLVRMIDENGGCLDTGFLGTPFLLDALCRSGHTDKAYLLLMQDKSPSWLYEVKQGATTIWESWFSYTDQGEPMQLSYNHYAFGCVDDWMFRYVGGVTPLEPGFKRFAVMIPKEICETGITSARRSFLSENGEIVCEWEIADDTLKLHVQVPCNTTAEIHLWDGSVRTVGSGEYQY